MFGFEARLHQIFTKMARKAHLVNGAGNITPPADKGLWDALGDGTERAKESTVAAIKTKTDNLPTDPASTTDISNIKQKATGPAWNQDTDSLEAIREAIDSLDSELDQIRQKATGPAWNQDTDSLEAIREAIDLTQGNNSPGQLKTASYTDTHSGIWRTILDVTSGSGYFVGIRTSDSNYGRYFRVTIDGTLGNTIDFYHGFLTEMRIGFNIRFSSSLKVEGYYTGSSSVTITVLYTLDL